ncbi:TIGR03619 family F420-dependent LLM class oxidoreductase [Aquihabitans sp. G128]|uniref:TIGR03619 family F420-dependent LLM class oxidoreductase n=1 Tax=Aquihabitans sp. G128 TaxID=2849779 RepID=UPI001C23089F|nr:TIGR03619 family F420-dependent LLM class oxidoreductase [Aquihabitans sp. G128]QXC59640.1 TIGR03619 family F420-dependent LLM class oxidoreductase [Aquihabitans sp. G128]
MRVSLGLPTHRVDQGADLVSGSAIGELSAAAEEAGFGAVYVTEHPFPTTAWLDGGGHHALDPLVALSFAAAATRTIRLHTNLFVAAYRNPFLAAKGLSTLDVLSGGRLVVGVGAGYLEGEYDALGGAFATRNDDTDAALAAWRAAWTGESVVAEGDGWRAPGNTMLPRPAQQPGPPIWIGGNSKRAIRRAVELADGWSPFPTSPAVATATRTAALRTPEDLAGRLDYAREHAASIGRTGPFDVAFIPRGLRMGAGEPVDADAVVASCAALAAVGVNWITVAFAEGTRDGQLAQIATWATDVLPALAELEATPVLPA